MGKYSETPNSKGLPTYLSGVGEKLRREKQAKAKAKASLEDQKAIASGKLKTASFKRLFPKAINHGHGNFEDEKTGSIWEVHGSYIVRRNDGSIRDVLRAINDRPDMSDEEYHKLVASL